MNSTVLFAKTSPLKLFFIAAIPGAVSMLAAALYQTFDGAFVGHFLGPTAFAAINLAMPFAIINFSLADLIGVGSSVPISICLGRKQKKEADTAHARERKLQETMLDIKKRFGKNAILKGLNLEDGATARERNNQIGGHKA